MNKIIISLFVFLPFWVCGQDSLYNIQVTDLNNNVISMNTFSGKKIAVVIVDAADPDWQQLQSLDTLLTNRADSLRIIAMPVTDFGDSLSGQEILAVCNQLGIQYAFSQKTRAQKAAGTEQHPLLQWVTHKEKNGHFDKDVEEPGQIYVISETGILFAILKRKTWPTGATMQKILSQQLNN